MAKLYLYYSSMNAGKSTALLQASYNYQERGMHTLLLTPAVDDRYGDGRVTSRIGLQADAEIFTASKDLFKKIEASHLQQAIHCVLVDEAQFLTRAQVIGLGKVCDYLDIPVLAYGLRTDFQGELFPGSAILLAISDVLREIRTICWCGRKATMVVRLDGDGRILEDGDQVAVGGEESYVSLCRRHWDDRELGPNSQLRMFL